VVCGGVVGAKKRKAEQEPTHEDGSPENQKKRPRTEPSGDSKDVKAMDESSDSPEQDAKDAKAEEEAVALVRKLIPLQKEILALIKQLAQPLSFNDFLNVERTLVDKLAELGTMWSQNLEMVDVIKKHIDCWMPPNLWLTPYDFKPYNRVITEIKKLLPELGDTRECLGILSDLHKIKNDVETLQTHIASFPQESPIDVFYCLERLDGSNYRFTEQEGIILFFDRIIPILVGIESSLRNFQSLSPQDFKRAAIDLGNNLIELQACIPLDPIHNKYIAHYLQQPVDHDFRPYCLVMNTLQELFRHIDKKRVQHYQHLLNNPDIVKRAVKALNIHLKHFPFEDTEIASRFKELVQNPDTKKPTQIHRTANNVFECLADLVEPGEKEQFLKDNECQDVIINIDEKEAPKLYEMTKAYAKILDLKIPVQLRLCFNRTENSTLAWYTWRRSSSEVHTITFNMNRIFKARTLAHELGHALQDEKGILRLYDDWNDEIDAELIAELIMAKSSDRVTWEKKLEEMYLSIACGDTSSRKRTFQRLGTLDAEEQHLLKASWPDEWAAFTGCHSSRSFCHQQLLFAQYLHNLECAQVKAGKLLKKDRSYTHPPYLLVLKQLSSPHIKERIVKLGLSHLLANGGEPTAGSACAMDSCEMDLGECCTCCR